MHNRWIDRIHIRFRWAGLAILILMGCAVELAWAHPTILAIEPTPDAILDHAPPRVMITFNEAIEPLSRIEVRNAQGTRIIDGRSHAEDNTAQLTLDLPILGDGLYTVIWIAAGSDGHVVRGNFAFRVRSPTPVASPASLNTPADALPTLLPTPSPAISNTISTSTSAFSFIEGLARWCSVLGMLGMIGGWAFLYWVVLPIITPHSALIERWSRMLVILGSLALLATIVLLLYFTAIFASHFDSATLIAVISTTRTGQILLLQIIMLAALLALSAGRYALPKPSFGRSIFALVLSVMLLLNHAAMGHAASDSSLFRAVLTMTIHLAAASLWIGGLIMFTTTRSTLLADQPEHEHSALLAQIIGRFSTLAMLSVGLVTLSGSIVAFTRFMVISDLWQTDYGRVLLVKLILFGFMLLLGAYHLLIVSPALRRSPQSGKLWLPRFRYSLTLETCLACALILIAAILAALPPPERQANIAVLQPTQPPTLQPSSQSLKPDATAVPTLPFSQSQDVQGLHIELTVSPNKTGENRFEVRATDKDGHTIVTQLVRLSFSMPGMELGNNQLIAKQEDVSHYSVSGSPLSMVGDWQIAVLVRRADADDVIAKFTVPVRE